MSFGPKNSHSFYTAIMIEFQREWDAYFNSQSVVNQPNLQSMMSSSTPSSCCKTVHGSRIVIDDILLYSTNVFTLLRYFSCVARVFVHYRLWYYFGRGRGGLSGKVQIWSAYGLGVAQSWNTSFVIYWTLCVLLVLSPWFEINLKPLRLLQCTHHRKEIPSNEWTPDLIRLFNKCKSVSLPHPFLQGVIATRLSFWRRIGQRREWGISCFNLMIASSLKLHLLSYPRQDNVILT